MRTMPYVLAWAASGTFAAGILLSACENTAGDLVLLGQRCPDGTMTCFRGLTSSASSSSGGTPPGCVPSDKPQPVADTCGIFVSSSLGKDGAAGTKAAPLKALAEAITKAGGRPIYACAEAFTGSVTLASGSAIYGGLDCPKDWA